MSYLFFNALSSHNGRGGDAPPAAGLTGPSARREVVVPAADVAETDAAFVITLDMPGLRPDSIDVRLENRVLMVAAERPAAAAQGRVLSAERLHGWFERGFELPETVDGGQVEARYDSGTLTLTLPKRPQAQPRLIQVKTAN